MAIMSSSRASNSGPVFDEIIFFPDAVRLSSLIAFGAGGGGGGAIGGAGGGGGGTLLN